MSRDYVKMAELSEEVFRRKAQGETTRVIGESYGLSLEQIRNLVKRQNRNNELVELRMQVELLRNFLSEAGRR